MLEDELHNHEKLVLISLGKLTEASPGEIADDCSLGPSSVNRALLWLGTKKLINTSEEIREIVSLDKEGITYLEEGLPERKALDYLKENKDSSISDLSNVLDKNLVKIALGWLRRKNFAIIDKGVLKPTGFEDETADEKLLEALKDGPMEIKKMSEEQLQGLSLLKSRQNVIKVKERSFKKSRLTDDGIKLVEKGIKITDEISQLTHEHLKKGSYKDKKFRQYDVDTIVPELLNAKMHPLRNIVEKIRDIFLQMGFEEIQGPMAESSFWNFDALFVPQDHPAREMQDTFYLEKPEVAKLPDKETVEAVKSAHENGGISKSIGWRYKWSRSMAKTTLLRTHTTATTIRALAERKKSPIKVFSVDRVFRNERITYKHIPEFHQCEGIVVGDVNFNDLLGILKEFYAKMGFEKVRFRPGFFPYTEPSVEVEVFFEEKGKWLELGGAGVFRPEVTEPLGITEPVLAWGLGLERLAMLRLNLNDIRTFYLSDIDELRRLPVRL